MCDMGISALVLSGVAAATSVAGQFIQSQEQEKQAKTAAKYNAQVAENEAAMQQQLAQNEVQKGIADRERQQRAAAREMGSMRAEMGASGFQMDTGSMVSLLGESALEHQYDSNIINQNAAQAAFQHQVGMTGAMNNKSFADYQHRNASAGRTGAYLGMGGSLLGDLGRSIGQYGTWQQNNPAKPSGGYDFGGYAEKKANENLSKGPGFKRGFGYDL